MKSPEGHGQVPEVPQEQPPEKTEAVAEEIISPEERERQENLEQLDSFISKIEAGHYDGIIFLDEKGRTFWRALHERCKATKEHALPQAHFVDIGTEKKIDFFSRGQQFRRKGYLGEDYSFDNHRSAHFPNPEMPLEVPSRVGFPGIVNDESNLETPIVFSFAKETFGTEKKFEIKNKKDIVEMLEVLMESDAQKVREIFGDRFDGKKVLIIDEKVETAESIKYAQVLFETAYPTARVDIGAYGSLYNYRELKKFYEDHKKLGGREGLDLWDKQRFDKGRFATEGFVIEPIEVRIDLPGKPTHIEERYLNKKYWGEYSDDRSFTVQGVTGEMNLSHKRKMAEEEDKWVNSEEYSPKNLKKKGLKGYADQIQQIRDVVSPKKDENDATEKRRPDSVE